MHLTMLYMFLKIVPCLSQLLAWHNAPLRIPLLLFTVVLLGIWTPGTEIDRGVRGSDSEQLLDIVGPVGLVMGKAVR